MCSSVSSVLGVGWLQAPVCIRLLSIPPYTDHADVSTCTFVLFLRSCGSLYVKVIYEIKNGNICSFASPKYLIYIKEYHFHIYVDPILTVNAER